MGYPIYKLNAIEPNAIVAALQAAGLTVIVSPATTTHVERVFEISRGRMRAKLIVHSERLSESRLLSVVVGHRLFWFGDLKLVRHIEAILTAQGATKPSPDELCKPVKC